MIEIAGIRFGLYAVMNNKLNRTYLNRVLPGAELLDPEKVTAELVPELRKKCDVVVALSHLNEDVNRRVLDKDPGIDVMVDPLSRNGTKPIWVPGDEFLTVHNEVPIVRVDGQGARVGLFEMYFEAGAKSLAAFDGYDAPLEPHIMRHPDVERLVRNFEKGRTRPLEITHKAGRSRLLDDVLGQEGCAACHDAQFEFWKSTKHADTYSTLEKTQDHFRSDCVGCHTLGYGITFVDTRKVGRFKEVQCESCHGFNLDHASDPEQFPFGKVADEACWGCHNPEITLKDFVYEDAKDRASCPTIQR